MRGSQRVIDALNALLRLELAAINQYFAHSKMSENWGYERLAKHLRETAMEEMHDADEIIGRILFLEGAPSIQMADPVPIGSSVPEQIQLALDTERRAIAILGDGIAAAVEEGDQASREFFAGRLQEEERHVDWAETQLGLIEQLGIANYLTQQLKD